MKKTSRRIVTGLDPHGRSTVLFDGPITHLEGAGNQLALVWRSDAVPANNEGDVDAAADERSLYELVNAPGTNFTISRIEPSDDLMPPGMHASNTLDYVILLEGEMLMALETGEVRFQAGDLIVDRGVLHGWRVLGDKPALLACVSIPAIPVGAGSTF